MSKKHIACFRVGKLCNCAAATVLAHLHDVLAKPPTSVMGDRVAAIEKQQAAIIEHRPKSGNSRPMLEVDA